MSTIKLSQKVASKRKIKSATSIKAVVTTVFAFIYASILTSLPLLEFQDRANYLQYASSSDLILARYQTGSPLSLIFNEPIWLLINIILKYIFEPEQVLRIIIFAGAFLTSYAFLKLGYKNISILLILIFLLLIPQTLKNHITHLRQGLGIGFFMYGLLLTGWTRIVIIGITPFIHSSFFFVIALTQIDRVSGIFMNFSIKIKAVILMFASILLSLNLQRIALLIGDRRATEYDFASSSNASGLGWLFWLCILVLMLSNKKNWLKQFSFAIYFVAFYLVTYPFIEITARIFESSVLLVFLACINLKNWTKYTFLCAILIYGFIQWYIRLNSPQVF